MIICRKLSDTVYTFIIPGELFGPNRGPVVESIESNSKSYALDRFFDSYGYFSMEAVKLMRAYYFNNKGELKEINLLRAYRSRQNL